MSRVNNNVIYVCDNLILESNLKHRKLMILVQLLINNSNIHLLHITVV